MPLTNRAPSLWKFAISVQIKWFCPNRALTAGGITFGQNRNNA